MTVVNSIQNMVPTLYAQGLAVLRANCVMPRLVMNDFGREVRQRGDTIQIPLPSLTPATAVVPAAYAPDPGNLSPTTATIPLSNWYESAFALTEQELAKIIDGYLPVQITALPKALAENINAAIFGMFINTSNSVGTPGTTPFGTDLTAATNARKTLSKNLAPMSDRRMVLGPDAYAAALAQPSFYGALYSGTDSLIKMGEIGMKFGLTWHEDQQVPFDTLGTITTGLAAAAATPQPVGSTSIACTTATGSGAVALNAGNLILFANDAQVYSLTSAATQASPGAAVTLNITPAKVVALAGGEAVTLKNTATGIVNLCFHQQAFAFASRPLMTEDTSTGTLLAEMAVPDPISGITMRMQVRREFHRYRFSYDILYGVGPVRPNLAVRVYG